MSKEEIVKIGVNPDVVQVGTPFAIFIPGFDRYNGFKLGREITLQGPDGNVAQATIRHRKYATLFEQLTQFGTQTYLTSTGIPYDPANIVDDVQSLYPESKSTDRITDWYTVITVIKSAPAPVTTVMPPLPPAA